MLKDYQGQGDYISEDMGQGQDAAQADAATAYDLGAFADLTFFLKGSQPYWSAVAQKKIVGVGPLAFPDSWFQRNSPYWYSVWPSGSKMAQFIVNVTCRRLAGLPAVFAGDAAMHDKKRVFGLVTPENPEFMELGDSIEHQLQGCGVKVEKRVSYAINVATFQAESTNMVAQLKASGVTSVLCYCDPLVPQFLSDAADQQNFRPEWVVLNWNDPQARLANQDEWAHAISNGGTWPKRQDSEAYRVFKLAHPDAEPAEQYFDVAYMHVLFLFTALQAAGPNLTPETLQAGLWSLPPSEPGVYGTWAFGPGTYSPGVDMEIGWWNPDATSNRDGKKGAWQTCGGEDGGWMGYFDPAAWGSPGTQLSCFGR